MNNNADIINFVNNTSLVDYLATNCGLSLAQPNYESKVNLALNTAANIPSNIGSAGNQILEKLHSSFGSMINPYW
jgi:hypothetical protein